MYVYIFICVNIYIYILTYLYVCMYMYTYMHACTYLYACIYKYLYSNTCLMVKPFASGAYMLENLENFYNSLGQCFSYQI